MPEISLIFLIKIIYSYLWFITVLKAKDVTLYLFIYECSRKRGSVAALCLYKVNYLLTYLLYLLTYLHNLLTYLRYLFIYSTYLFTLLTYLFTFTYLFTLLTYLLTYLFTLLTYLLYLLIYFTYLFTLLYLLTHSLTYSTVRSPSWAANRFAASQEIPLISRNPKVHYRTHKRPPTVSILGQPNPVHIPTSHILEQSELHGRYLR